MQKKDMLFGMFWQRERFRKKRVNEIMFEIGLVGRCILWYTNQIKDLTIFPFLGVCQ